jgi:hypothetical protein
MPPSRKNSTYAVVLQRAALRIINSLSEQDRDELCDALLSELRNGPNADKEVRFNPGNWGDVPPVDTKEQVYTATPLSFGAYTAVHRPLTDAEMDLLRTQNSAAEEDSGYNVVDILPPESAFRGWPRSL